MKKLFLILFLLPLIPKAQTSICAQNVCIDTIYQPVTTIYLVARVISSTDPIVSRGWSFTSGPTTVPPMPGVDSARVVFTTPGIYTFSYAVTNSKGATYSGKDVVTVIALTVKTTTIYYQDGTNAASKPIKQIIVTYTNGTTKTVNL